MRRISFFLLLAAAATTVAACDTTDSFNKPCERLVGESHVLLDSAQMDGIEIALADSVQLVAGVKVVESARAVAVGNGTVCEVEYGDPIDRPLVFTTSNVSVAETRDNGWVIGRGPGLAAVIVSSTAGAKPVQIPVLVEE